MKLIENIIQNEFDSFLEGIKPLSGGSINHVYLIQVSGVFFIIKLNDSDVYPDMFEKEVLGLTLLDKSSFKIPEVIKCGKYQEKAYLILEYIKPEGVLDWPQFGSHLAHLHLISSDDFGLSYDNYIGSLIQSNKIKKKWSDFYVERRILPLLKKAFDMSLISRKYLDIGEHFCKKLSDFLPVESPSLLHGDLWSGNLINDRYGSPVLIDPAVYFGFREMDLAMLQLFGSIPSSAIDAYQDVFPLHKDWQKRVEINQLYPLLVHLVIFGSSYYNSVRNILRKYS
tara:strand:+ start:198 stop:1046 length:849 start_codon:yes stop_codon:yes gene_type:complete